VPKLGSDALCFLQVLSSQRASLSHPSTVLCCSLCHQDQTCVPRLLPSPLPLRDLFVPSLQAGRALALPNPFSFSPHPSLLCPPSAQREPARVDVHLGDPDELERRGEAEGADEREVAEEVGELVPLLQLVRGVVEHALVEVAGLLDLQLVDVAAEAHELPGQLLVLQAHFCLKRKTEGGEGRRYQQRHCMCSSGCCLHHIMGNVTWPEVLPHCKGLGWRQGSSLQRIPVKYELRMVNC